MASHAKSRAVLSMVVFAVGLFGSQSTVSGDEAIVRDVQGAKSLDYSSRSAVILQGVWGKNQGEFGKVDEASRPGPMDFAVVGDEIFVLDSVNARVQVFTLDGDFQREISIGTATADFLSVDNRGNVTVLDAFVKRECRSFGTEGSLKARIELPQELGLPSAIFTENGTVWVEERHNQVFEISTSSEENVSLGKLSRRISGRPFSCIEKTGGDTRTVHARKNGRREVIVRIDGDGGKQKLVSLRFPKSIVSVAGLDTDSGGRSYLTVTCLTDEKRSAWNTDLIMVVISPDGEIAGTINMPNNYVTDHYRKVFVTPAGEVYQMQTDATGVRFIRWTDSGAVAERGAK